MCLNPFFPSFAVIFLVRNFCFQGLASIIKQYQLEMSTEKEGSLLPTEPNDPTMAIQSQHPHSKERQSNENDFHNQFLMPIKSSEPKTVFRMSSNGHRTRTEPRQEGKEDGRRKRQLLLPEIKSNETDQNLERMREKSVKLRELYEKKNRLYKRLEFINKKLVKAKLELSYPYPEAAATLQPVSPLPVARGQSKSYSNSRNHNYLLDLRPKKGSPESTTSITKNRQVISFIQKMHQESIKRELARHQRSQQLVSRELSHVCLECTRAKCQADAVGSILRQSRQL